MVRCPRTQIAVALDSARVECIQDAIGSDPASIVGSALIGKSRVTSQEAWMCSRTVVTMKRVLSKRRTHGVVTHKAPDQARRIELGSDSVVAGRVQERLFKWVFERDRFGAHEVSSSDDLAVTHGDLVEEFLERPGASAYDYESGLLWLSNGAVKYQIYHSGGHDPPIEAAIRGWHRTKFGTEPTRVDAVNAPPFALG
jgi:hypothetical protein